jgi:uncharacterized membrane protein YeiB
MRTRIAGFDLARAYAIFGMFIVNFNFCFGSFENRTPLGRFLNLFTGNSTAIFIICAGMGLSLMTSRIHEYSLEEKRRLKTIILKRSWFLLGLGLLLYSWWPGDILHFYGGYMHFSVFLLFAPRKYLLIGAIVAIAVFHLLLLVIPIWTSWDLSTFKYQDFWTVKGFLRNTLYNGWNSIFPWIAYFLLGMWLGRIDWQDTRTMRKIFFVALFFFVSFEALRRYAVYKQFDREILDYIMFDYFPPYLPFMIITASFALMVITVCIWLGRKYSESKIIKWLAITGGLTLSNYVFHLTVGILIFQALSGKKYTGFLQTGIPSTPGYILTFSILLFLVTVTLSVLWTKRFKKGPLETLMRKISG